MQLRASTLQSASETSSALGSALSEIDYLIRERREPQKFLYVTRIGGGCAFREPAKAQASTTMLADTVPLT